MNRIHAKQILEFLKKKLSALETVLLFPGVRWSEPLQRFGVIFMAVFFDRKSDYQKQ